ncbi:beta-ketoacyl-[acyl-carrier-protein] synthase family protein [Nonomuraea sp. NPDC003804]|uniref:beta-ketoacyl-[acyl-carrier-protein] synthase family protein n=1 Tax=Nonomuraea sp. NPDC003804 TaxID=3154547 RepID=UPI0033AC2C84
MRKVVVTGRGAISPIGLTWAETWAGMCAGRSGIRRLSGIDVAGLPVRIGGQIDGFDPMEHLPAALVRRTGRTVHLALAAARAALDEAGLPEGGLGPRAAVVIGSVGGHGQRAAEARSAFARNGVKGLSPYTFAATGIVGPASEVALLVGAQGPVSTVATACATGATCVGEGMRLIREGRADVVLAGGADDTLTAFDLAVAARAGALSRRNDRPEAASRPFDRGRDGFVMSAGAGVLVLESAEHAAARGARVFGELAGYGATTDAHHLTAPHPQGTMAREAMRAALAEAGVAVRSVGYVNAHGTSTRHNDATEIVVLRAVLEERAASVPISSTKSVTGHMLAAAGAVEAMAMLEVIRTGIVPPTVNCDDPEDPELDFVPQHAQARRVDVAVSNSFGFGGHNAVLVGSGAGVDRG